MLIVASLAIGVLATIAQQAVPFAAEIAPPSAAWPRGRHGDERVAAGDSAGADRGGRRCSNISAGARYSARPWSRCWCWPVVIMLRLPKSQPTSTLPYGKLLVSMWHLIVEHRACAKRR